MAAYRAYLNEEKDISFDFGSSFSKDARISELFSELTRRLEVKYDITKGVLVLRNLNDDAFSAVSTWHNGEVLDGLKISLPNDASLFEQVARDGRVFSDSYYGMFSGNFFEKKLLVDDTTRSYVLHPLKHEGQIIGMIGYSSGKESAFTMIEEGALQNVTNELAGLIREKMLDGKIS